MSIDVPQLSYLPQNNKMWTTTTNKEYQIQMSSDIFQRTTTL